MLRQAQDFQDPEVRHRHVSHLFGLFPGYTITVEKTPDLCKAAGNTLNKRGMYLMPTYYIGNAQCSSKTFSEKKVTKM